MTIGITGATGQLGRIVVEKLKARGKAGEVVALVRDPAKAADLGVAARVADYDRPETLATVLQGIDTLLLISANEFGKRAAQHRNVIEAAKAAGVKRIVYTSLLHAPTSSINLAAEHRVTEADLAASGIPYTVLRNGWYSENYASAIGGAVANGGMAGSAGEGKISAATREDYAEAAAVAVTEVGHEGKVYELAGDEPFTMAQLAAEVARQTGKPVTYTDLPEAKYVEMLKGFGLPAGLPEAFASWDVATLKGDLFEDGRQLSKLIGRPTTPISDYVARANKG